MGIFYNDPSPPTGNFAGTPPFPHAPIGTQGDQPPRYMRQFVGMMAIVVSAWPIGVGPDLPYQPPRTAAILNQPRVDQPPISNPFLKIQLAQYNATWQQDWPSQNRVTLDWSTWSAPKTAAITNQPTVSQPPTNPPLSVVEYNTIVTSWPNDVGPYIPIRGVQTAAITRQPAVSQPPTTPPLSTVEYDQIVRLWQQDWPAQSAPKSIAWFVIPQTAPVGPISVQQYAQLVAANQVDWGAQSGPKTAPITSQPVVSQPIPNNKYGLIQIVLANQVDWPAQTYPRTTPVVSQPRVDQPPTNSPLSTIEYTQLVLANQIDWQAQRAPISTAWTIIPQTAPVGPVSVQQYTQLVLANQVDWAAQTGPKTAAITSQPAVSQPTPIGSLSVANYTQLVAANQIDWQAQTGPRIAPTIQPRAIPVRVPYELYVAAWTPEFRLPQQLAAIPQGVQAFVPATRFPIEQFVAANTPDVIRPTLPPNAGWNVPPPQNPPFRQRVPWNVWVAWEPPFIMPQVLASYTIGIPVAPFAFVQIINERLQVAGPNAETLDFAKFINEVLRGNV